MSEAKQHGPWLVHQSKDVYQDPWITVQRDEVTRPDGNPGSYCIVHLRAGVSVIAIDSDDHVYLTKEFHYGVGRVTLEAVSGGIEDQELALETAQRELKEELGITAESWEELATVDPFTASLNSPTKLYVATGLEIGEPDPEGTEEIQRVRMPFQTAVDSVFDGTITHTPTCVLLLMLAYRRAKK